MVVGRVQQGEILLACSLPAEWEGQSVKIEPCTPDDPMDELEQRLAALHALGPMEYEPGERERNETALAALNELSRTQLQQLVPGLDAGCPTALNPNP